MWTKPALPSLRTLALPLGLSGALLGLGALAQAQAVNPTPPGVQGAPVEPTPLEPSPGAQPGAQPPLEPLLETPGALPGAGQPGAQTRPSPPTVPGLSATLSAPRSVSGEVPLTLTLQSSRGAVTLGVGRDNEQNCATAPRVRVLRVGTREVVYPAPGAEPRLCAQDLETRSLPAGGRTVFTRRLALPAGEYMIEGWLTGFVADAAGKVPAAPVRVTVK